MTALTDHETIHPRFEPLPYLALAAIAGRLLAARAALRLPGLLLLLAGSFAWIRLAPVTRAWARWLVPLAAAVTASVTLCAFLPAENQAVRLDGTVANLTGQIVSAETGSFGTRAVLRQAGGVRLRLLCDAVLEAGCHVSTRAYLAKPDASSGGAKPR